MLTKEESQAIENPRARHDSKGEHKKLKEAARMCKSQAHTVLGNNNEKNHPIERRKNKAVRKLRKKTF